ncbi:hypothetical protein D3C80_1279760 [compost metagenome]
MNNAGISVTKWKDPIVGAVVQAVCACCKATLKFSNDFPPRIKASASLNPFEAVK